MLLVSSLVVTIDPKNVTTKVFWSVTLTCYTNGFGDLLFVWEHDDSVISTSNSTLQQNSLTIDSVLPQHQGQYKCTVIYTSFYKVLTSHAIATLSLNSKFIYRVIIVSFYYTNPLIYFIPRTIV